MGIFYFFAPPGGARATEREPTMHGQLGSAGGEETIFKPHLLHVATSAYGAYLLCSSLSYSHRKSRHIGEFFGRHASLLTSFVGGEASGDRSGGKGGPPENRFLVKRLRRLKKE